jgi:hypothetical protein
MMNTVWNILLYGFAIVGVADLVEHIWKFIKGGK